MSGGQRIKGYVTTPVSITPSFPEQWWQHGPEPGTKVKGKTRVQTSGHGQYTLAGGTC